MTRIVGGSCGGRRIAVPTGRGTRPTADRVREALFASLEAALGQDLAGCRFLDLYAGSGAVGLEALSRGAASLTAVESDARAARVLRDNVRLLGVRAEVVVMPVERVLAAPAVAPFDVVYADPPYALGGAALAEVLSTALRQDWLAEQAVVVVERSRREADWAWPEGLVEDRERGYGDTVLRYASRS